jgi:hypothetical protein
LENAQSAFPTAPTDASRLLKMVQERGATVFAELNPADGLAR